MKAKFILMQLKVDVPGWIVYDHTLQCVIVHEFNFKLSWFKLSH